MTDTLTRRDFLFYGSATLTGVTLGDWGRRLLAQADARAAGWRGRGVERWATSVCRECPAACGVRVRLVDEVPVKLEGNPLCPVSRGRLCAKGQAALEAYFDPDRLVGPARRTNGRGEDRWELVAWKAALAWLAREIAAAPRGTVLVLGAPEDGPLGTAWTRFWTAAGARVATTPVATAPRWSPRLLALTGVDGILHVDLEHATHVLSFGAPLVEDWLSPVWTQRSYGRFRRGAGRPRGRLVQIDWRRSLTARKADEWLAVPMDHHAALAYGVAAVLLRENRVARPFLDRFAGNLAEFERRILAEYMPDRVAEATGIPVVTVLRLARELIATERPVVVTAADAPADLVDAVLALNALIGAFDRPGGLFAIRPRDGAAAPPEPDANLVLDEIARGAYRPRVVVFRDPSPLRQLAASPAAVDALKRAPFIASLSPYRDETTTLADLLLPTATPLERWHAVTPAAAVPGDALAVAAPAVAPRLDTRDPFAVLRSLADLLGGDAAAACTWQRSDDLVRAELARRWALRRGAPYADPYSTEWLRQLEGGGWWEPPAPDEERFVETVLRVGGWYDPFYESGWITATLAARGGLTFSIPGPIPVRAAQPPPERPRRLRVLPFTPAVVNLVGSPNQPMLYELLGQPEGRPWEVWVEMSPEAAAAWHVAAGDRVRLVAEQGALPARVVLVDGMPPGVAAVAFVPAVPRGGRWARLVEADVRRLVTGTEPPVYVRVERL